MRGAPRIADVDDVRHRAWTLPAVSKNASWRVKVVGKTTSGKTVGSSAGAKFTVGALRVGVPNGGERILGGATWKLQTAAVYAGGRFDWPVPAVTATKTKCRVRVDLLNGATKIGSDTSSANFTILP